METPPKYVNFSDERLLSLDLYPWFDHVFVIAEIHLDLRSSGQSRICGSVDRRNRAFNFNHHPHGMGLRFWDLVQPFFMFIVWVYDPFFCKKRRERGDPESEITRHA
ncbi:MAG: hypothetical protein R3C26_07455 [Calditrichia bacterium]